MASETFIVTALPYSAAASERFHVSLFVTHRLTPDGAQGVLSDFAIARDWTSKLANARITLRGGAAAGGDFEIECAPLLTQLDESLWPRVFPGSMAVRPWRVPNHTATAWHTFPAHRMQRHALLLHGASIISSPVSPPSATGNALTAPLLEALGVAPRMLTLSRLFDRGDDKSGPYGGAMDLAVTERLDALVKKGGLAQGNAGPDDAPALLPMLTDLHRARRFYQRDEDETAYRERPLAGATLAAIVKPKPDFHERAGMLGDLSPLLRKLGLIIDLKVDDVARLSSATWIQGDIVFTRVTRGPTLRRRQPRTACKVVGQTFSAVSSSGDYELGMLKLADEGRFTVLDLDPDASALKLEQFVRTMPRLVALEKNGDAVTSAPSTLRATGIAVARHNRAAQLHARVDDAAGKDAALLAGTAPLITLEQVNRGLRLEVWDDVSGRWHSLHERRLSVTVEGAGEILLRVPDTGFLQGASLTHSDTAANAPKYAHEVLAGWDGWSLSVPRPGKVVVHDNGDEVLHDAPPPDATPVNPVVSTTQVAPGTLPRLRYGRSYALRAYAVDLAGNSRPHAVGDPANTPASVAANERAVLAHAEQRLKSMSPDATQVSAAQQLLQAVRGQRAAPGSAQARTTMSFEGPGARGVDTRVASITKVDEVDRLLAVRFATSGRSLRGAPAARSTQIERHFADAVSESPYLMERIDVQTSPAVAASAIASMIAQQPGLGAVGARRPGASLSDVLIAVGDLVTTPRPFLRWDPVIEPVTVPRHAFTEGESLLRMVLRSGVQQHAPGEMSLTITAPGAYAAATKAQYAALDLAWREDCQRHLAPPKTSQFEAEMHGVLDTAFGAGKPAESVRSALGVALREAGTLVDDTVADLANPGQRLPQPGVTFHMSPTADAPKAATPADLNRGDGFSAGQYVAHDVDALRLPYLPDPLAAGVSFTFPDAHMGHHVSGLMAIENTTLRYTGRWPEPQPFRLVLESGASLSAVVEDHVIRVTLPPGEQLRMRMSSSIRPSSLELFGLWRSLPALARNNALLKEAAADGWFWWLTPHTELRLVHAVPRPVEVPRVTVLVPTREANDTAVVLAGAVDVHAPSTDRIDIEGTWSEWIDDIAKPEPELIARKAAACGTGVTDDEDLVVLGGKDITVPLQDNTPLRVHAAVHQMGDTKHRIIDYRVRATTRYREYFPPQVTPDVEALSVVGAVHTLDVPSSARPPKVAVRDVLPLFRWHEETVPSQPFAVRRTRRAGVRIYLERPWYATGDGELLAVLVGPGSGDALRGSVSQWGGDPVWLQQGPAQRTTLPLIDMLQLLGLDDRAEPGRPVGAPVMRPLVDLPGKPSVAVLGYKPEFAKERGLWFVDVALDPGTAFWPFVQFAVARYQPSALPGMHLGPVLQCDFVQLAPERMATLSRPDDRHARVMVTGAVGLPKLERRAGVVLDSLNARLSQSRTMRARLERFDAAVGTDLAWETVSQQDLPVIGTEGPIISWGAEIALTQAVAPRTPGSSALWRVTLEEWEWLPADTGGGGTGGLQPRIVYAEHLVL